MIVFDSSTLILLAKSGLLDAFLEDYQGKVLISQEVETESCSRKKSFDALLIRKRIEENRIKVVKASDKKLCEELMQDFNICKGEAESLVLAIEKKARLIATDDRNAIKACRLLKIPFTSAIAILVRMAEKKAVEPERTLAALSALEKYGRYSEDILKEAKTKLGI
jgi:predicted nucleic acid-binding protein